MTEHPFHLDFNLDPPDNERLANLCGALDQHLRQIEGRLGVEISNRGNRFRVIGTPEGVRVAGDLLERIYASTEDEVLTPQQVHLFVQELGADAGPVDTNAGEQEPEFVMTKRGRIRPRGQNQNHYLGNISRHDINFGVGPAGTGKTYLAVACAVDALERDQVRRILLVRPAVEAGERLGFLPGDLAQKIDPYLRPLYDALYEMLGFEHVARLIDRNVIEIAPLAYMRGRTLNESFVILDEAQNTTIEQMKMFLTRIGYGSKVVVTGDVTQVDLPKGQRSGLRHATEVLSDIDGISFTFFNSRDVVRHPLVQSIVDAYASDSEQSDESGGR